MILKLKYKDHYGEPLVRYIDDIVHADMRSNRIEFSTSTSYPGCTATIWIGGPDQPCYLALLDSGRPIHEVGENTS